jgi:hypothetical protein
MNGETGLPNPVEVARVLAQFTPTLSRAHDALNRLAKSETVYVDLALTSAEEAGLADLLAPLGVIASVRPSEKTVDVARIRKKTRLTQAEFASRFGFELGTVRNWEQGRYLPNGHARVLLQVIDREPDLVQAILDDA